MYVKEYQLRLECIEYHKKYTKILKGLRLERLKIKVK